MEERVRRYMFVASKNGWSGVVPSPHYFKTCKISAIALIKMVYILYPHMLDYIR